MLKANTLQLLIYENTALASGRFILKDMNAFSQVFTISFLTVMIVPNAAVSQSFGVSGLHECDTINGLRVGLTEKEFSDSCPGLTNGLRLELLGRGLGNDSSDYWPEPYLIDDLRFAEPLDTFDIVNGVNISLIGTRVAVNVNGLSLALISQKIATINGLQISGGSNIAEGRNNGVQASAVKNVSIMNEGLQISVSNYSIAINGLQIGLFNDGIELYGVQIGLINRINYSEGVQIGLWNVNHLRTLPFISF